ncbi:RagB/SusD family nutrient uptake outer membrane protein [Mucilaginibacter sp. HD30]
MKHPISYQILILLLLCSGVFTSCKKFVEAGSPKNELTTDKVFADSADAAAAVTGIYINMNQSFGQGFSSGGITVTAGLSADELSTAAAGANTEFYANNISTRNANNASLWRNAYQQLYPANACIEGIAASPGITPTRKSALTAEARFVRAFLLFNLVNLYGPVPLVTMTSYQQSRSLPRATADEVYGQISSDLQFAQANLAPEATDTRRANYYAATALLARVYLYRSQPAQAITEASKVISASRFGLADQPGQVFLAGSRETLWRLVPVYPGRETWEASLFVPSSTSAVPPFVLSSGLESAFATSDKRLSQWISANTVSGKRYSYPAKYKKVFSSGTITENYVMLRLAEQYLIRAEARSQTGDITGATADLQAVQRRAGAALYTGDAAGLPAAIEAERRKELFCEWGHRWFDLKRTNRATAVLGTKPGWKANAVLFPVPQPELDANPALSQNTGY